MLGDLAKEVVNHIKSSDGYSERPYLSFRSATLRVVLRNGYEELECRQRGVGRIYFRNPYHAIQTLLYMGSLHIFTYNHLYQFDSIYVNSPEGTIIMTIPINLHLRFNAWRGCPTLRRIFELLKCTLLSRPVEWEKRESSLSVGGSVESNSLSVSNIYNIINNIVEY